MSDPECDRRRPRETVLEEREAKRVRFNVLDEEIDEWVETEPPRQHLFSLPAKLRVDPNKAKSRRGESPQFAPLTEENGGLLTDGETERLPKDLPQEWTGAPGSGSAGSCAVTRRSHQQRATRITKVTRRRGGRWP